jgi:phosphate acetyltransferase
LIRGFPSVPLPILMVDSDTHSTSMHIDAIRAVIAPDNHRKIASALGVFESYVDFDLLAKRIEVTRSTAVTPLMFEYELITRAKANRQHIVLPEGNEDRILLASEILVRRDVAKLTLLGNEEEIRGRIATLGLDLDAITIIDPKNSKLRGRFASQFVELRSHKGITLEVALDTMLDVNYFGTMMIQEGVADGMVSGCVHTTAQTIRPAFQIIKTRENCSIASSVFFMCLADRVLVYGDCAINPNPDAQELADIAIASADTAAMFGIVPRVAMLSYSTGQSGHGEDVDCVKEATRIARAARPELKIEGPIQYDAAIDMSVANTKLPESEVAGQATVFIFPDLNTGNNTYKAVQRSAGALAVGPVIQGLRKPVNDLSRGCTVADIVNTVAITAIQADLDAIAISRE